MEELMVDHGSDVERRARFLNNNGSLAGAWLFNVPRQTQLHVNNRIRNHPQTKTGSRIQPPLTQMLLSVPNELLTFATMESTYSLLQRNETLSPMETRRYPTRPAPTWPIIRNETRH